MRKSAMRKIMKQTLNLPRAVVTDITKTPGGLTNSSYFATVNGQKLVIRFPGEGTEELVDRRTEKANLIYATGLGVNPETLYFDTESGLKITERIHGASAITPAKAREGLMMKKIIAMFRHLHHHPKPMNNRFELFLLMEHYEQLVQATNPMMYEKLTHLQPDISELKRVYQSFDVKEMPCHIDAVCSNIIVGNRDELFLIDWEYSGMFDPLWDIATMFLSFHFNEEEELFFLTYYLEQEPENTELQRILLHKIFQDYLWSLWTFYKEAMGADLGTAGMMRIERAMAHMNEYRMSFPEDDVV